MEKTLNVLPNLQPFAGQTHRVFPFSRLLEFLLKWFSHKCFLRRQSSSFLASVNDGMRGGWFGRERLRRGRNSKLNSLKLIIKTKSRGKREEFTSNTPR